MIETAITMPLFVFIILGSLQLALAHQARLMTKYAAFKAVRVGAMNHARVNRMRVAAAMVLMPVISYRGAGGKDYFFKSKTSGEYLTNAIPVRLNFYPSFPAIRMVDVTVCSPTRTDRTGESYDGSPGDKGSAAFASGQAVGFDMPATQNANGQSPSTTTGYQRWETTRLAIQVQLNYRMPIPFANMMIYHIFENDMNRNLRRITRTGQATGYVPQPWTQRGSGQNMRRIAAMTGEYIIPIRAWYSMRMQSDLFPNADLPSTNDCVIPDSK
jgi:TadE-like protein